MSNNIGNINLIGRNLLIERILQLFVLVRYFQLLKSLIDGDLADLMRTKTLIPEVMNILPASMQYDEVAITHEYTDIPDELMHKVRFSATDRNNLELLNVELRTLELSNQKIALSYEPETVEDQEIINSYGGLDNTPAYLIRLRPLLKVDGEMVVAGKDGLPMGTDYTLTIELISPNGTERITSTQITANLSAIGITAGKGGVTPPLQSAITEEDDAETILSKEANRYIDRWNKSEEELASLLHLQLTRQVPTVTTIGGVLDVTYLLDIPHGFEWKGVFIDASLRSASSVPSHESGVSSSERQKTFMQLSALQGSILENRIFEDAFQVDSISTAKLFQIVGAIHESPAAILTIDKTSINTILPTLDLDDNIKEDITNAVNQGLVVRIPSANSLPLTAISYKDWTGIGYIKENPTTGESGYMLSGMIAGGMTAVKKQDWIAQDLVNALSLPYSQKVNKDPNSVVKIARLNRTADYQSGIVGTKMKTAYQVIALDGDNRPVQGVKITFKVISGGGRVQGEDKASNVTAPLADQVSVTTGEDGIARARLTLGKETSVSPYLRQDTDAAGNTYWDQTGLNLVAMSAQAKTGTIETDKPFEAYGKPAEAKEMIKLYPTTDLYGPPSIFASTLWVKVVDIYGNPISDKKVQYKVVREFLGTPPASGAINAKLFGNISECPGIATIDCPNAKPADETPFVKRTEYFGSQPYLILGNTENTKFTITATANKDYFDSRGQRIDNSTTLSSIDFKFYTKAVENGYVSVYSAYAIDEKGSKIDAWKAGEIFPEPLTAMMYYTEKTAEGTFKIMPVVKDPPLGSPLKNDARVEFQISAGGGSADPVIQTQDTNGSYSTTLKLGDTPGINRINAIGTVTASVPSYDASGNITRTDKILSAYFPIEIWGLKITVPSYQMITIDSEGYLTADVPFKYDILPTAYPHLPSQVSLAVYEQDQAGNESLMGIVQADSNGKLTLSKGTAKFDTGKLYYAYLALNRGTKAEIRSEKINLIVAGIKIGVDGNRDGQIELDNSEDKTYLFWINDDNDAITAYLGDPILQEEDDININTSTQDSTDNFISCLRDLEDFARIHLLVDTSIAELPNVTYHMRFKNIVNAAENETPSINLFKAINSSNQYLTDAGIAKEQKTNVRLLTIDSNEVELNKSFINSGVVSPFIFEGRTQGKGELTFIVKVDGQTVTERSVMLDLKPIQQFYDKYTVNLSGNTEDAVNAGIATPRLGVYKPVDNDYVLFVHGWNIEEWEKERWTETIFKRLWWQGYKGHIGVYSWPTLTNPLYPPDLQNYDRSELRAWNSAAALNNVLHNLNANYPNKLRVLAHSMGNIVASEAIRIGELNEVQTYIATQAAVSAHMYDNSTAVGEYWTDYITPNVYGHYPSGVSTDRPYFTNDANGIQRKSTLISYFNKDDFALVNSLKNGHLSWEQNNKTKPDNGDAYFYTGNNDFYDQTAGRYCYKNEYYIDSNGLLQYYQRILTFPNDTYEIFARCSQSRSKALGAVELPNNGIFAIQRNLQNREFNEYDNRHYSHSRQFRSNIITEWGYWSNVINDMTLTNVP